MTEREFLDRQEALAIDRVQRALLGSEGLEGSVVALERATERRPWCAVGTAAAVGGLVGALLGRTSGPALVGLTRFAGKPILRALLRSILNS